MIVLADVLTEELRRSRLRELLGKMSMIDNYAPFKVGYRK